MSLVEIEVTANLAEYAAMHGLSFDSVLKYAKRGLYHSMLADIHRRAA